MPVTGRRHFLAATAGVAASCAGCTMLTGEPTPDPAREAADVLVGPNRDLRFEPEEITVSVGDTVTWYFASKGHNVSCRPVDSQYVQLPDGADPFASFDLDGSRRSTVAKEETYSHTFEQSGEYGYVCGLHHVHRMIGTIIVEE